MMNFSAMSSNTFWGKYLRKLVSFIPKNAIIPILQGPGAGLKWVVGSGIHGFWLGSFEADKQRQFAEALVQAMIVYDIGASVGFYSMLAAKQVGPTGKVFSFDPSKRNCELFKRHLMLNKYKNVRLFEIALANYDGYGTFEESSSFFEGKLSEQGCKVKVFSLDSLVAQERLPPPDIIKIDVEGGEIDVLKGATDVLNQYCPKIFLATHGQKVHEECCEYLQNLGYSIEYLMGKSGAIADEVIAVKS